MEMWMWILLGVAWWSIGFGTAIYDTRKYNDITYGELWVMAVIAGALGLICVILLTIQQSSGVAIKKRKQ